MALVPRRRKRKRDGKGGEEMVVLGFCVRGKRGERGCEKDEDGGERGMDEKPGWRRREDEDGGEEKMKAN